MGGKVTEMEGELLVTLITGRTTKQGIGLVLGKNSPEYSREVAAVEVSKGDLARLGLKTNDQVLISNSCGAVRLTCREANIPAGIVFVPLGPNINALIDTETGGTGMPDFKGVTVIMKAV
jgi:formylmethanofuran dehydrogenase subunit D